MNSVNSLRTRMNVIRGELVKTSKAAVAAGLALVRNNERVKKLYARAKMLQGLLKKAAAMLHSRLFHSGKTAVKATRTVYEARGLVPAV